MKFTRSLLAFSVCGIAALSASASAQDRPPTTLDSSLSRVAARRSTVDSIRNAGASDLVLVTAEAVDRLRTNELVTGVARGQSLLLRSASSLTAGPAPAAGGWRAAALTPQFLFVINSAIPFSHNDGSLWAGRGLSTRTLVGGKIESSRVRLILAPELVISANSDWILRHDFYAPSLPPGRSPYDLPYYVGDFTIDQPMRLGDRPIRRIDLGQTTAMWSSSSVAVGFSNENEWWGPGIRNAIVLSNNAPGFPHLFIRTARPLETRFGDVEMRWLVGGLTESAFFDTVSSNNVRSIASVAATIQTRWDRNLSFGVARSVYATARGWNQVPWRWLHVLARTNGTDSAEVRKDHFYSLFGRWVFPSDGLELYAEWARLRFQPNLRDYFVAPNYTQGYTLGLQWRGAPWRAGSLRLQGEITQLEQSATFRDQPGPSWYTSTRVIQGYTNRGEMLGASIGPGASSQFVAVDYLASDWRLGTFAGRIRWNEDVHSNFGFPAYASYCNHDVSIYTGLRGAKTGRAGTITTDLTIQNRLNAFFQNAGGCPYDRRVDIHNTTISVSFTPGR